MPLILVIESDRRQTSKLSMLARNQLRADLLIVDNVQQALAKLDECDPDLILTSSMMSGHEQLVLGERLLEIEEEGLRIQTLTMPQLSLAGQRARLQKTAPGRAPVARGRAAQTDSMDPVAFGMQIANYLQRIATERASSDTIVRRRAAVVETEEPEAPEESPAIEAPSPIEAKRTSARLDWNELLEAMRRDIEVAQSSTLPQQPDGGDAQEMNLDDEFERGGIQVAPETSRDVPHATASVTPADTVPAAASGAPAALPAAPVAAAAAPARKTKKVRRVPPQDEFGFFDPRQCGLSALYAKLDTITPPGKPVTPKKPS